MSRRTRKGYTLVEMLAALLVLCLAMTALLQSTRLFALGASHAAAASARVTESRRANGLLDRALGTGPYAPASTGSEARLDGDGQKILFACGAATDCQLQLAAGPVPRLVLSGGQSGAVRLPGRAHRFRFVVRGADSAAYPAVALEAPLEGVVIVDGDGLVVAGWRSTVDQSPDCAFDDFNHRCFPRREGTP